PFVDMIDLSYDGEPFLHPQWDRCVRVCRDIGVKAQFETNCLLLDGERASAVLKSGLAAITLSIDAASEETYRSLKPSGDYGRVVANAEVFLALAARAPSRPYIQIQFVSTPQNRHEAAAFRRYWAGKGADAVHVKPMLNFGGSVGPAKNLAAVRPCIFLWTALAIQWDGKVPLCCLEIEGRTRMGDAAESGLRDIFRGKSFEDVRRLHVEGNYRRHPVCRDCWVPSVAWPFVLGAAFTGDLFRRKMINLLDRFRAPDSDHSRRSS
ncbi:MAG TPA: SPASM domain-containing protein, partial [bacterium]|nr:SPASM domain-containing protein [bacterium]